MHYLAQIVNGNAKIVSADITLTLQKGDFFYIPKNLAYRSYWYPENDNVSFYSFGFDFFPTSKEGYKLQKIPLTACEQELLEELKKDITPSPQTVGQLYHLLGSFEPRLLQTDSHTCPTINKALSFMRQNSDYTMRQVAESCGISESGLYIAFKKHLNKTPVAIRQEILCGKAKEMLSSTDLSIEEISDGLGFSSSSYFRKIFKTKIGKTPTSYRKEARGI